MRLVGKVRRGADLREADQIFLQVTMTLQPITFLPPFSRENLFILLIPVSVFTSGFAHVFKYASRQSSAQ